MSTGARRQSRPWPPAVVLAIRHHLVVSALLLFLFLASSCSALCVEEPAFAPFPAQLSPNCTNDPAETKNLALYLIFSSACADQHATWVQSVAYFGRDGKRSTATAVDTHTLPSGPHAGTMTFRLPIPITALADGGLVGAGGQALDAENWRRLDWYVGWRQVFEPGVVVQMVVQTVPVYQTVTTPVTSTLTETTVVTATAGQTALATASTVVGEQFAAANAVTVTPRLQNITRRSVVTVTETLPQAAGGEGCDHKLDGNLPVDEGSAADLRGMARQGEPSQNSSLTAPSLTLTVDYTAPNCGAGAVTTVSSGVISAITSIMSAGPTSYTTTTVTVTETAAAVLSAAKEERALTPVVAEGWARVHTKTYVVTRTVYHGDSGPRLCKIGGQEAANGGGGDWIRGESVATLVDLKPRL